MPRRFKGGSAVSNLFSRQLPPGFGSRSRLRTIAAGAGFTEECRRLTAWNNVPNIPDQLHKIDCDGRQIVLEEYGQYSGSGWQIDHITPIALGGPDIPSNWRARHWKGNSQAGSLLSALRRI
jgi:hypothetical protein